MKVDAAVAAAALMFVLTLPGAAHHSERGLFDETRVVEMRGVVTEWYFVNPHPILRVEITGEEDGQRSIWTVTFGASGVASMRRLGFSPETFTPGEELVVKGHQSINGYAVNLRGPGSEVTRGDGAPIP